MWFIFKISIALAALGFRFFAKKFTSRKGWMAETIDDTVVFTVPHSDKNGVHSTSFVVPFRSRSLFKLTSENAIDRFFKNWGLAWEIQTGDHEFDKSIYIASDSAAFGKALSLNSEARGYILNFFKLHDCKNIRGDGEFLWITLKEDKTKFSDLPKMTAQLFKQIANIDKTWKTLLHDPFAVKALCIEAVIWSLATYSYLSFMEWKVNPEDLHVDSMALLSRGLICGTIVAVLLVGLVISLMSKSSRGHRILVESALVLGLSLPVGGISIISDINTQFDSSPSFYEIRKVVGKKEQSHRRKNHTYYTYHIYLQPVPIGPQEIDIPGHIEVSITDYNKAIINGEVEIALGRGRLSLPWYRSFFFTPPNE